MSNIIIPVLILAALAAVVLYSACIVSGRESREEERPRFTHPPMDLRLPSHPCGTCTHWEECNGVDWEECCKHGEEGIHETVDE